MFIFSLRASTVRFFALLLLISALFVGIALSGQAVFASASSDTIDFTGMKSEDARISFIAKFGYEVNPASAEVTDFVMPENFDRVMLGYNEIQKTQGLDLSKYAKKRVTRYTYEVTNYKDYDGEVYVNLLIYRGRVIGCDVSSCDPEGFVLPLIKVN